MMSKETMIARRKKAAIVREIHGCLDEVSHPEEREQIAANMDKRKRHYLFYKTRYTHANQAIDQSTDE